MNLNSKYLVLKIKIKNYKFVSLNKITQIYNKNLNS